MIWHLCNISMHLSVQLAYILYFIVCIFIPLPFLARGLWLCSSIGICVVLENLCTFNVPTNFPALAQAILYALTFYLKMSSQTTWKHGTTILYIYVHAGQQRTTPTTAKMTTIPKTGEPTHKPSDRVICIYDLFIASNRQQCDAREPPDHAAYAVARTFTPRGAPRVSLEMRLIFQTQPSMTTRKTVARAPKMGLAIQLTVFCDGTLTTS